MQRKRGLSCGPVVGVAAAALVIAFIVSLFFWTKVDAGTACVVTRGGKVTEVATPGYNFKTPLEQYHCYNTRLQSMEEQFATQGVVMDIQTFTPVQSIMVTVTPSYDTT